MSGPQYALGLAAASIMLCGCVPSQVSETEQYRSLVETNKFQIAEAGPTLSLVQALQLANRQNETLSIEGENYLQALIARRRTVSAFLPVVSLGFSRFIRDASGGNNSELDDQGQPLGGGQAKRGNDYTVDGNYSLSPISDVSQYLGASVNTEVRKALLFDVQDRLLLDTARAYFETVRTNQLTDVLRNSIRLQEARLADVRARNEVGLARVLDVNLTESQNAQTRTDLVEAETNGRTNRAMLEYLTASPHARTAALEDSLSPDGPVEIDILLKEAFENRQDLYARFLEVETAGYRVSAAYGRYFPSLSVNLAYFLDRDSEPTDRKWNSLIELSLPLFSAGVIEADVRTALSQLRKAKLVYLQTKRGVERDIQVSYAVWQGAEQRFIEAKIRLASATTASDAAEATYSAGLASNLERLTAEDDLVSTRLQLTNADLERALGYLDVKRNAGTLHTIIGLDRPRHAAPIVSLEDLDA